MQSFPEEESKPILKSKVSRRAVLGAGVAVTSVIALAACTPEEAATTPPPPAPEPSENDSVEEAVDFTGTTLEVWAGATIAPPASNAALAWEQVTGGKVIVTPVPFSERAIKFAGLVTAQDSSVDLLYAAGGFVSRFGTRLYDDLAAPEYAVDSSIYVPATLPVLSKDGILAGLPIHSEMNLFIYNKTMFEAAGLDPEAPPKTWSEMYAAAAKLQSGNRYGCAIPWSSIYSAGYYLIFLNSIPGAKLLSEDRTQVLFGGAEGLAAFETIEEGVKAGFFTPGLSQDVEDYATGKLFNDGQTASMVNFAELWGYAVGSNPTDFPTTLNPDEVGVSVMPGVTAQGSGSINGFEGLGINKFGTQKEAAIHFLKYVTGPEFQLEMNLSKTLPSSNTAVLDSAEVQGVYPIGAALAEQGQSNLDRYASPYDWEPPIATALLGIYNGELSAADAHKAAYEGVQRIVESYLVS